MDVPRLNGYQVRTEKTKAQVLLAAEEVFTRDGFEAAQMESIAKAAGRSKGAIYAHYKSKDDLFLALFEHRTSVVGQNFYERVVGCRSREQALGAFKQVLIETTQNRTWILLMIEAKLHALRHPEMRERWLEANHKFRSKQGLFGIVQKQTTKLILGEISPSQHAELEARTMAFGPIINGLVLEAEFEPKILSKKRLGAIINEVADALFRVPAEHEKVPTVKKKNNSINARHHRLSA